MPVPEVISYHEHVTERVPGPDTACRWASGVEFIHDGYNLKLPVNRAEWQALQAASGDTGTSNMGNFRTGVKKRYNIDLNPSFKGPAEVRDRLTPGRIALLSGKLVGMDAHYRRFYPDYTGGHTVYAACYDPDEYWWCDPGSPELRPSGEKYLGEPISWAQLKLFIGNYGYEQIFKTALPVPPPPPIYTQAQMDAATKASYNTGLAAVKSAAAAVPPK
jgi:hypothetical protein